MKKNFHFPLCLGILLAVLAGVTIASAQRNRNGFGNNGGGFGNNGGGFGNNGGGFRNNRLGNNNNVPGPTNYAAFSGFIAVRNIFNPARLELLPGQTQTIRPRVRQPGPEFSLVGTMIYEKGLFAFFDGNNYSYRKVFYQSDSNSIIAGYTVTEITPTSVQLQSADKKTLRLNIGDVMRQNGSVWQLVRQGELSTDMGVGGSAAPAATESTSAPEASAAPSSALEGNDILKRLMQQREQELK